MKYVLIAAAAFVAAPLSAQNQDLGQPIPEGGEVETIEESEGLSGSVSFEGNLDDLGIAIPGFATDRDVETPASASGTAALGKELARVITSDLRNNGLFKPTGPDRLPAPQFAQITDPAWGSWSGRGAEMLVHGYVRARGDERLPRLKDLLGHFPFGGGGLHPRLALLVIGVAIIYGCDGAISATRDPSSRSVALGAAGVARRRCLLLPGCRTPPRGLLLLGSPPLRFLGDGRAPSFLQRLLLLFGQLLPAPLLQSCLCVSKGRARFLDVGQDPGLLCLYAIFRLAFLCAEPGDLLFH